MFPAHVLPLVSRTFPASLLHSTIPTSADSTQ